MPETSKSNPDRPDFAGSRVFRQVVTMEIIWLVGPEHEPPFLDTEAIVRDAIVTSTDAEPEAYLVPGEATVSAVEELTPEEAGDAR